MKKILASLAFVSISVFGDEQPFDNLQGVKESGALVRVINSDEGKYRDVYNKLHTAVENNDFETVKSIGRDYFPNTINIVKLLTDRDNYSKKRVMDAVKQHEKLRDKQSKTEKDLEEMQRLRNEFNKVYDGRKSLILIFPAYASTCASLDPNKILNMDNGNEGLLHIACKKNNVDLVKYLVDNGADINRLECLNFRTPLCIACENNNVDLVKYLVEHGADINKADGLGTPLSIACSRGNLAIVEYLVEHGADINKAAEFETPLSEACSRGNLAIVEYLVEHGANVDQKDNLGQAPLHIACENSNKDLVEYLVEHGANVRQKACWDSTPWDRTPLYIARKKGNKDIVEYLVEHGAGKSLFERVIDAAVTAAMMVVGVEVVLAVIEASY